MKQNKQLWMIGGIIIAALVIIAYLVNTSGPVVSAQGYSSIESTPDTVSVYIQIESRNATVQIAKDKHDQISEDVLVALTELGLKDSVTQAYYNVYPDYTWTEKDGQKLNGYVVTSQLVVKTTDFETVSEIVDAAIDNGALISSINFELSDEKQSDAKSEALAMASADAKKKAVSTASGLGKHLGSLVSVQSQDFYYPGPIPYYAKAESGSAMDSASVIQVRQAALNLAPQDIEVSASVTVEYRLRFF